MGLWRLLYGLSASGKGHEVGFRNPSPNDWLQIIKKIAADDGSRGRELKQAADQCDGNFYRLFHMLLARESGTSQTADPSEALMASLDAAARTTLFLAYAAAGLVSRSLITRRFSDPEEQVRELGRYDGLLALGLIREEAMAESANFLAVR